MLPDHALRLAFPRFHAPASPLAEHPAARPSPARQKLRVLSVGSVPPSRVLERLGEIAALPGIEGVLALPDLHQKPDMEAPSSLAVTSVGTIVPEFTSVALNDGMGIVATDLTARDLNAERVTRILMSVSGHAAAHPLDRNRYSLGPAELHEALLEGARAGVRRYGLDPDVLRRMEWGGCITVPGALRSIEGVVPWALRATALPRCEMGLNFGGNHFLEIQEVDRILDPGTAERWGLQRGQIVVMYHLGPGPLSGNLLHHYSRRRKLDLARVPLYLLSKLAFHFGERAGRGNLARKWALHFRTNGFTPFTPHSPEGLLLRQALAMAANFGFAYRLATVAAIRDALHETVSPGLRAQLLCDVSHNSLTEEPWGEGHAWVARHNACRLAPGEPAIVAGAHDVPSYLCRGAWGGSEDLHSYDHGAGHLIEGWRRSGRLPAAGGGVVRLRATRGAGARLRESGVTPVRTSEPVDSLLECLDRHRIVHPVARLRPVGNLKN